MIVTVYPSVLNGNIEAPPSKSMMQRVVALALLAEGESCISNPDNSHDSRAALKCAFDLGANIKESDGRIYISGPLAPRHHEISVGESGLGVRLFTPLCALSDQKMTISGTGSLLKRPISVFAQILPDLKVRVEDNMGFLPIHVHGPMQAGKIVVDGSLSSQYISGLLIALSALREASELQVENAVSKPYLDLTLELLEKFGVRITQKDYKAFYIPAKAQLKATNLRIGGDWSAGATLLVAAALTGDSGLNISGLNDEFTQADQEILQALRLAGLTINHSDTHYLIQSGQIRGFNFDATHCPDLFPVLAALAVFGDRPTVIKGSHRLKHKESDRATALQTEFAKAGIRISLSEDEMTIYPSTPLPCTMSSHNDHRIVMAAAILGMKGGPIQITDAQAISKSYPHFFEDLKKVGARVETNLAD